MHRHHVFLGIAGLIPFLALPFASVTGVVTYFEALSWFNQYSAIILSFFGGVHWMYTLMHKHPVNQVYLAMLPSIVAWLSLAFLPGSLTLIVLALSYLAILFYDQYALPLSPGYVRLRALLTGVALGCHGAMYWIA